MAQGSFGGNFYRVDFFEIAPNNAPYRSAYTPSTILGNFTDPIGGACAPTGFIGSGLSRCQNDYRVASNVPGVDIEDAGGIDVNLKPYQQREFTFGAEHELHKNWVIKGRYTNKKLLETVEDAGAISATGSEIYITGNPGKGLHAQFLTTTQSSFKLNAVWLTTSTSMLTTPIAAFVVTIQVWLTQMKQDVRIRA